MILNDRDRAILDFIEKCPTNSFIIQDVFFPSLQTCQRRLIKLHEAKLVKRYRSHFGENFIYYIDKKPKQIEHTLYLSKLYASWLQGGCKVEIFKREIVLGKLRPDAIAVIRTPKNEVKTYLVEVEISNNPISKKLRAYEDLYLGDELIELLGCKPHILFVTNKKIENFDLTHEVIRLKDLEQ